MIEALTPQLLMIGLLLLIALASILSLLASLLVRWLYRRRVLRAMDETVGGFDPAATVEKPAAAATTPAAPDDAARCYRHALALPWRAAARDALAGLAYVAVMTAAVGLAFPPLLTPVTLALFAWGYAWPVVLAFALNGPAGGRGASIAVTLYFSPLLLFTLVALLAGTPAPASAQDIAALRTAITPSGVALAWLSANAVPTLLLVAFLNRRLRAVGPPLLALITIAIGGCLAVWLSLFTEHGSALVVAAAVNGGIPLPAVLVMIALATLAMFTTLGWWLLRRVRHAYLAKTLNDSSLARDALWLYFSGVYAMYYAAAGLAWALIPLLAFGAYTLAGRALRQALPTPPRRAASGLTYLRVFSLGRRSDRLFDALARHWRHIGSLQLITGPDLALSTLQPNQLLDFLAGRLATHFVADSTSLARRLEQRDRLPDRDGLFRINNFFCHADSWQAVLAGLVRDGDRVLMDLRSFSPSNTGCVHELTHLVKHVPLARCVLLVDHTTDLDLVQRTLHEAWQTLRADSPNHAMRPQEVPLHHFAADRAAWRALLRHLCEAG